MLTYISLKVSVAEVVLLSGGGCKVVVLYKNYFPLIQLWAVVD